MTNKEDTQEHNNQPNQKVKKYPIILEILPLFFFFGLTKYYDIFIATGFLILTSVLNFILSYWHTKYIHVIPLITSFLAVVFGGLTLVFANDVFIKFKVSLMNFIFAFCLIIGPLFNKNVLKLVFKDQAHLTDKGWEKLNLVWIVFFIGLGTLNEVIWRHFSTDIWVNFKVFGIFGLTTIFLIAQIPFIKKHSKID